MDPNEAQDVRHLVGQTGTRYPPVISQPLFGPRRTYRDFSAFEWAFMAVSTINLLTTLGFTIHTLVTLIQNGNTQDPDFTFVILIFLNIAFCLVYAIHSVFTERKYEVVAFILATSFILLYCAVEYGVNEEKRKTIKLVRLILASVLAPLNIGLAIHVLRGFRWFEFRVVGASELLQRMYTYTIGLYCLLKFDLQASLSIVVLALVNGSQISKSETAVLGVGVPFSIMWVLLGWTSVRWEVKPLVAIFAILGLTPVGYVCYKIYTVYIFIRDNIKTEGGIDIDLLMIPVITLIACALFFFIHIFTYCILFVCVRNFGSGLKEKVVDTYSGEGSRQPERPRLPTAGDL